jgi:valyl-tRNA synthetase
MEEIPKLYNPKEVEKKIYKFWEKTGFFNPDKLPKNYNLKPKYYSIVIPPPNITGSLHMGHALNCIIQDILIRKKRMEGFKTLWLPGTDHAGIATQYVVEKELKKEGKTRFDLGREKFIERVWQWVEKYGEIILEQFKRLGCSLDWSRTRFTLDKEYVKAVETAFWHYYKKGLIYQGERVVNWCPQCKTSLSDLEIEYEEEKGNLWYIKYPLLNYERGTRNDEKTSAFITVATTRPETMLGDSAVAVNPKDERYKDFVGKKAILPLVGREIPIIADNLVDKNFGTGAVKITPAHDLKDYEISKRHNLKIYKVIDEEGKITNLAPEKYRGLSIFEAREKIVEDLKEKGLLEKIEDFWHSVPKCYRCKTKIEFLPMRQWFLKMENLAKTAIDVVKSQKVKFFPKRFEKIYFDWLKSTKDWCISRQIWWGHKIPIEGEEDVLDTWFSSALWPFAALGWPKKTKDLKKFYPTNVLSTGRDIINLWVARMIFSGMEFMKKPPFKIVLIHPTVLTKEGKRMSKSLGTGADPMEFIEKYGGDATRFGIIWQVMGNQDLRFTQDHIKMGQKFCNKVWNASRFVLLQIQNSKFKMENLKLKKKKLGKEDKKILKALNKTIESVNKSLEKFQFGKAAHLIYNFFWHDFCDKYIEEFKIQKSKVKSQKVLLFVLLTSLKLLHPFIPFITEEIYQILPIKNKKKSIMVEKWPKQI